MNLPGSASPISQSNEGVVYPQPDRQTVKSSSRLSSQNTIELPEKLQLKKDIAKVRKETEAMDVIVTQYYNRIKAVKESVERSKRQEEEQLRKMTSANLKRIKSIELEQQL